MCNDITCMYICTYVLCVYVYIYIITRTRNIHMHVCIQKIHHLGISKRIGRRAAGHVRPSGSLVFRVADSLRSRVQGLGFGILGLGV